LIGGFRRFLHRQQFSPGFAGIWLNPFFLARKGLWRAIGALAPHLRGALLDIGCGGKPYQALFKVQTYTGLEIDSPQARARKVADRFYDGGEFPFESRSFDSAFCSQVLEHVFDPDRFIAEIVRVLKPGGTLLLTVPFVWDEHEQPWDYARYSSFGLKALLERHGLRLVEQHKLSADVGVLFQLINAYLYKITITRFPALNLLVCALLMAPVTLLGLGLSRLLPANPDLYLDQVVLADKS